MKGLCAGCVVVVAIVVVVVGFSGRGGVVEGLW